jgi:membrane protein
MARSSVWRMIVEIYRHVRADRTLDLAAQFAYWSLLALFPFAIFLLTIVGFVPLHGLDAQLVGLMNRIMPDQAAQLFDRTLHEIVGRQRGGLLALALFGALWSATGGMSSTMTALNRAYQLQETRPWWRRKLLCMGMTVGAAGLMIIGTMALLIGPSLMHRMWELFGAGGVFDAIWRWVRWPLVVTTLMVALALLDYFLPNRKQTRFRFLTVGAVAAILIWIAATAALNAYVRHFAAYAKTYGTLGAAVVLMTWLYLSGLAVSLGGEINAALEREGARRRAQEAAIAALPSSTEEPIANPR